MGPSREISLPPGLGGHSICRSSPPPGRGSPRRAVKDLMADGCTSDQLPFSMIADIEQSIRSNGTAFQKSHDPLSLSRAHVGCLAVGNERVSCGNQPRDLDMHLMLYMGHLTLRGARVHQVYILLIIIITNELAQLVGLIPMIPFGCG